jgi:SulP family sulfate permease
MSAIDALHKLTERYHRAGKTLHLRHFNPDCRQFLSNAWALINVNVEADPLYTVAGRSGRIDKFGWLLLSD